MGVLARAPPEHSAHSPGQPSGVISHPCYALFTLQNPLISGMNRLESIAVSPISLSCGPMCARTSQVIFALHSAIMDHHIWLYLRCEQLIHTYIFYSITLRTHATVTVAMMSAAFHNQSISRLVQMGVTSYDAPGPTRETVYSLRWPPRVSTCAV